MNLTENIKQKTINLRQIYRIKLPGTMIAATVIYDIGLHKFDILTLQSLQVI